MSESRRIQDQLRRAFDGEAWHGPAVREVLAGVSAERAAAHPIPGAHSIWELVIHIGVWEEVALRRVRGETVRPTDAEDWPAPGSSRADWSSTLTRVEQGHAALVEAIGALPDSQLDASAAGERYSIYVLLHGVVQHDLYHAGQIALLKKALSPA
jgi:uncharacterized damage-inducible protein DinB